MNISDKIAIDAKSIIKEFEQDNDSVTIVAMAHTIGALREKIDNPCICSGCGYTLHCCYCAQ